MIHITGKIPKQVAIAVSGGIDSMAVLDFLRRSRDVVVLHYNHGTPYAPKAEALVRAYCMQHKLTVVIGRCERRNACWCFQGSVVARSKIQVFQ